MNLTAVKQGSDTKRKMHCAPFVVTLDFRRCQKCDQTSAIVVEIRFRGQIEFSDRDAPIAPLPSLHSRPWSLFFFKEVVGSRCRVIRGLRTVDFVLGGGSDLLIFDLAAIIVLGTNVRS